MANIGSAFKNFTKAPLKSTFDFLGGNPNSAVWVAVAIALFKGIFRPIFTMRDKKSDPQTKKYTAIREALTELIAIPVYATVPTLGAKFIREKWFKNESAVTQKAVNANVKFWGVLLSTAIIPAVCNLVQPPIMNWIKKKGEAKKAIAENSKMATIETTNKPSFNGAYPLSMRKSYSNNYGMRVGN